MKMQTYLPGRIPRFVGDTKGVSAVEFALVLPLMLTLYLGGAEVAQAISASRKVTLVSRTIADLTSQFSTISTPTMTSILSASSAVLSPFSSSELKVTVSQLKIDETGAVTVEWSDTRGGATRCGASVTLPEALKVPKTRLIWGEAEYGYTPPIGYAMTGTLQLKDQMYMRPRMGESVTRSTVCS